MALAPLLVLAFICATADAVTTGAALTTGAVAIGNSSNATATTGAIAIGNATETTGTATPVVSVAESSSTDEGAQLSAWLIALIAVGTFFLLVCVIGAVVMTRRQNGNY